jgi:chromosomal replication initiation ATPase DnaA
MFDPASQERVPDPRLRGMNPAFVKRIWEKRRKEAEARRAQQKPEATCENIVAKYRVVHASADSQIDRHRAEQIIKDGAKAAGFRVEEIRGNRRFRPLVKVRQSLIARVYVECPHLSLPQIGKAFGGLDHTTCLHAIKKLGVHYSQTGQARAYVNASA